MKRLAMLTMAVTILGSLSLAQLKQGAWGITADVTGSSSFGIAYAMQPNLRLGVNLGFGSSGPSGAKTTSFGIGIGGWYYLGTSENVSAFVGGAISFESQSQDQTTANPNPPPITITSSVTTTTFGLGPQFGAEYWFSQKFAIHGYLQFKFGSSSSGGGGGSSTTITTNTQTGLTWYF